MCSLFVWFEALKINKMMLIRGSVTMTDFGPPPPHIKFVFMEEKIFFFKYARMKLALTGMVE